jgi:CRISPR/Cas system-associated endoribonuclease Cas2
MEQVPDLPPLDYNDERTVPALALHLLSRSTQETARIQSSLYESEKKRADAEKLRADSAEYELHAVQRLHAMLADPKYASRLISLLIQGGDVDEDD